MQKGQAVIEFMLTYGWVILVVIIAIGALIYFGVLSPKTFNKEQCEIIPGLDCVDFRAKSDELTLILENNLGQDIFIQKIEDSTGSCSFVEGKEIQSGKQETFIVKGCKYGSKGERLKTEPKISYQTSTGRNHTEKALLLTFLE
jgi:hypothetical protein